MFRQTIVLLLTTLSVQASEQTERSWRNESSPVLIQMLARSPEELSPELQKDEDPYRNICDVLLQRREVSLLIAAFLESSDATTREYLVSHVLYEISDPAITRLFHTRLSEQETLESYYMANYLAKFGDEKALEILNRHYFQYPVSSLQWAETVILFGKFRHRPAIPNLIRSLDAASLNLAGASIDSLKLIFPKTPPTIKTLTDYRNYFLKHVDQETILHK